MKLRVNGWKYENIRGLGNLEITLDSDRDIHLFMMPNGTGKTTTHSLISACFSGDAKNWSPSEVKSFKPSNSSRDIGKFEIDFYLDDERICIILSFDYSLGQAEYETLFVDYDHGGVREGRILPTVYSHMFTESFVKRFVFDGEVAKNILDQGSEEAVTAIIGLYQLDQITGLKNKSQDILYNYVKASKLNSKSKKGLSRYNSQIVVLEDKEQYLKDELNKAIKCRDDNQQKVQNLEAEINDYINSVEETRSKVEELEALIKNKSIELEDVFDEFTEKVIHNPLLLDSKLGVELIDFVNSLDKMKLPEAVGIEFFKELSENPICICGRAIGNSEKQHILDSASEYLDTQDISKLIVLKTAIREKVDVSDSIRNQVLRINGLIHELSLLRADLNTERQRALKDSDDELQRKHQEIENRKSRIDGAKNIIRDIRDEDSKFSRDPHQNLPACQKKLKELYSDRDEVLSNIRINKAVTVFNEFADKLALNVLKRLEKEIIKRTNEKIKTILKNEKISIQGIDKSLILRNKSGASMGQTLAITYSYIGSMFEYAHHRLPFIVDSPAGALDLDVRREVAEVLPQLFDQLIVFITSGEREGFGDSFYETSGVQYTTIFSDDENKKTTLEGIQEFKNFQSEVEI